MALVSLHDVSLRYGGLPLLDGVELHIERGDRVCLLGVNGAGKSSLLRVMAGESSPDAGQVITASGVRIARLPQQVPAHLQGRVCDIVCPDPDDEQKNLDTRRIISRLHLDHDADFATLSGGTQRRVLLAQTLLGQPDVVLLDEPTNHLDLDSIAWLEEFLLRYCRTFLFVTHDRSFLRRLATRIIELDRGHLHDWQCDYDTFLRRKEESLHIEERRWHEEDRHREKEEGWLRQGVKARAVRNQGRLRALQEMRAARRQRRERIGSVQMVINEAERTGQVVLKAKQVAFGYQDCPIIRDFSTIISRGDKVGILGPNGCGKTTLLRLLLDADTDTGLKPRVGNISHGTNLRVAYSDQFRAVLDETQSLAENIAQGQDYVMLGNVRRHIVGYLQDFLFSPDRIRQPVSSLSGGERNRLLLARLFAQPSNVLVLDEPTNDLDLDTLDLLEERIDTYSGTVLIVSHDRTFLNNVVTSVMVFEKHNLEQPGTWLGADDGWYVNEYVGGYDDWAVRRIFPPVSEDSKETAPRLPPMPTPRKRKRISEKEQRELASLPARIEAMEEEQSQWHGRMADPAFYRKGGDGIAQAQQRMEALATELECSYRRWEELEARVVEGKE